MQFLNDISKICVSLSLTSCINFFFNMDNSNRTEFHEANIKQHPSITLSPVLLPNLPGGTYLYVCEGILLNPVSIKDRIWVRVENNDVKRSWSIWMRSGWGPGSVRREASRVDRWCARDHAEARWEERVPCSWEASHRLKEGRGSCCVSLVRSKFIGVRLQLTCYSFIAGETPSTLQFDGHALDGCLRGRKYGGNKQNTCYTLKL